MTRRLKQVPRAKLQSKKYVGYYIVVIQVLQPFYEISHVTKGMESSLKRKVTLLINVNYK